MVLESYIDKIQEPANYSGPKIATIIRDARSFDVAKYKEFMNDVIGGTTESMLVATFSADNQKGAFSESFNKFIREQERIKFVDLTLFFEMVMSVKSLPEQVQHIRRFM